MGTAVQRTLVLAASIVSVSAFVLPVGPFTSGRLSTPLASPAGVSAKRSWIGRRSSDVRMTSGDDKETIVVVGNGMVGHKFIEALKEKDAENKFNVVTFCEERRAAYNRMRLTEYFLNKDVDDLSMSGAYNTNGNGTTAWYDNTPGVECLVGDKAVKIDRETKTVISEAGKAIKYDKAVLATGSYAFVPPTPGVDRKGVFVYRTIEDLEDMISYQKEHNVKAAAVIGGGLLGLEAAKAMYDLGMETHIIEFAPILMCRQIDDAGHAILGGMIENLGLKIHCNARATEYLGDEEGKVSGMKFSNEGWEDLDVGMIVVSAGIRPRDEIARASDIAVHERGGVIVDDLLRTNDEDIYAIGEVALHGGKIYGLVAPGYEMAEAVANQIATGEESPFTGADMSTKLKLMGVDVASFGRYSGFKEDDDVTSMAWNDPFSSAYKKLFFNKAGTKLLGGILVGDASEFYTLLGLSKSSKDLPMAPGTLLVPAYEDGGAAALGVEDMADDMQVCSCNNVDKGTIFRAVTEDGLTTVGEVKSATKAGTGCGGCEPLVKDIFAFAMEKTGMKVSTDVCEHFAFTRQELFDIVKAGRITSFTELLESHGHGDGCEICKPLVSSILSSINNDMIFDHDGMTLLDTNDRALANMQRGGSYSVVPRVPAGELLPEQLIAMGDVAKKFNLYTKITGGQRIDLFGAEKHELPTIWEELGKAGLESGHAYGKSLRTVKSCVGSTWCRYGVQDSVSFAVEIENRYKGLRSPHKLKCGVSGCVRECAEAQGKDFGLVATEKGYNLYVCGNGGAVARHADLLATDLSEELCIKYIDRFLMFYVATADRLQRTAPWLDKLEGGIEYLRDVVINDKLGIADKLEAQMQHIVDTYQDEWATVVQDEEKRKTFRQFVNSDHTERGIPFIDMRGQNRPMDWPKDEFIPPLHEEGSKPDQILSGESSWVRVGSVSDFPVDGGATVLYGKSQLAVYNIVKQNEWFATQNVCPHKRALVLSQGIVGSKGDIPKVACPLHKNNFDLQTGECLDHMGDENMKLMTFPVKIEDGSVFLDLPPTSELDQLLATEKVMLPSSCMQVAA
ncbi:unnamed protein product [Ascophyllum nodosum]